MARQAVNQAKQTFNQASGLEGASLKNANDLYSTLMPVYSSEIANPQGFSPTDMADMNTANEQSLGGGFGAVSSGSKQEAAANRNSGSFNNAIDEASRVGSRQGSTNAVNLNKENAMLKQENRQSGIRGMNDLYNTQNADVLGSLGLENQSTNAETEAGKSGWFQNMTNLLAAIRGSGYKGADGSGFTV